MNPLPEGMRHIEAYGSTLLSRVLAAVATLSLHILIARAIAPAEYGAIAFLVTVLALLLLLISFGNEPLLVREGGGASPRALSVAVIGSGFAVLLALAAMMSAGFLEALFRIPGLERLLLWGMPVLPLQALQNVPRAEMLRRQEFQRIARIDALSNILAWAPAALHFLLFRDPGAFVLYLLAMHTLRLVAYWRDSALIAAPFFRQGVRMRGFLAGWRIFSIDGATYLTTTFDDLVIAGNLGAAMLGIYHFCYRIIAVAQEFFAGVMRVLSYPRYVEAAPDRERVYRLFCSDTRFMNAILLPVLAVAFATADTVIPLLLGKAWSGSIFIFQMLTIEAMRQSLLALGAQALIALGDERRLLRFSLVSAAVLLPSFVILSFTDLRTFVIGFVSVNTILNVYFLEMIRRSFARPLRPLLIAWIPGLAASAFTLLLSCCFAELRPSGLWTALATLGAAFACAAAGYALIAPDILRSLRAAVRAERKRDHNGTADPVIVYVDGPFDRKNPHLQRVYAMIRAAAGTIEFRPLHFRSCLRDGFRYALYPRRGMKRVRGIIHMHYPAYLYSGGTLAAALRRGLRSAVLLAILRMSGFRFIFTLHDLGAHDFPFRRWERCFLTMLFQGADRATTLSNEGERLLFTVYGRAQVVKVVRHCMYDVPPYSMQRRRAKRDELGIADDACVVLLFGTVKPYKGYDDFIRICDAMREPALLLVCAGSGMTQLAASTTRGGVRTVVIDRFIGDGESAALMDAADFGALPYRRILHSGTAMLYASHGCPVIAPRMGGFIEQEREYRIGLYYDPASTGDLERAIRQAVALGRQHFTPSFSGFHAAHRCEDEANAFLDVYRELSGEEVAP
jgi:beta-1,4-mannosyltransferase